MRMTMQGSLDTGIDNRKGRELTSAMYPMNPAPGMTMSQLPNPVSVLRCNDV